MENTRKVFPLSHVTRSLLHPTKILSNSSLLCHTLKNSFLSQQVKGCVKLHHHSFVKNHYSENIKDSKIKQGNNFIYLSLASKDKLYNKLNEIFFMSFSSQLVQDTFFMMKFISELLC